MYEDIRYKDKCGLDAIALWSADHIEKLAYCVGCLRQFPSLRQEQGAAHSVRNLQRLNKVWIRPVFSTALSRRRIGKTREITWHALCVVYGVPMTDIIATAKRPTMYFALRVKEADTIPIVYMRVRFLPNTENRRVP